MLWRRWSWWCGSYGDGAVWKGGRRASDKVMTVVEVIEEDVLRSICGYAPQNGRSLEEKQPSYDELKYVWDMHSAGDLAMCLGDINEHI